MKTDILIVGCGVSGLYCALNLPPEKDILIVTKDAMDKSDSYLAQGGICVLRDENDYDSFFEDTMRAGHYENNKQSVDIMIRSSRAVIDDLVSWGVAFEKNGEDFAYTKEGAHSAPRILFHEDETGKEITSRLLAAVKKRPNVRIAEYLRWSIFLWRGIPAMALSGRMKRAISPLLQQIIPCLPQVVSAAFMRILPIIVI